MKKKEVNKENMKEIKQSIKHLMVGAIIACTTVSISAQEVTTKQAVEPKGKAIITVFSNISMDMNTHAEMLKAGFGLDRAYLGYEYKFNDNWKAKVVYDMGKGSQESGLQRLGYLKTAEVGFHKGNFKLNVGLTSTKQFGVQEKFWGYRYVYKSFQDAYKWGHSADLGVAAEYKIADWISADLSIYNGEGYKKLQADKHLQYGAGLTITPFKGMTIRAYTDAKTTDTGSVQENIALFAGYKHKTFRLGAEWNNQLNHESFHNHTLGGLSVYGACTLGKRMELYARYDWCWSHSNKDWHYSKDGNTAMLGVNYKFNKLFEISPNIQISKATGSESTNIKGMVSAKINF